MNPFEQPSPNAHRLPSGDNPSGDSPNGEPNIESSHQSGNELVEALQRGVLEAWSNDQMDFDNHPEAIRNLGDLMLRATALARSVLSSTDELTETPEIKDFIKKEGFNSLAEGLSDLPLTPEEREVIYKAATQAYIRILGGMLKLFQGREHLDIAFTQLTTAGALFRSGNLGLNNQMP